MTKTSGTGAGSGLTIGAVATVVVVGGGVFLAQGGMFGPGVQAMVERQLAALGLIEPAPPAAVSDKTSTSAPAVAAPVPQQNAESSAETPAGAPTEPVFALLPPALEVVRVEPDGSGIIAGSAQPGVEVKVLLDDAVLDTQTVPEAGEFVSFVTITPSESARIVTLVARHDGQERAALDSFILMPMTPQLAAGSDASGAEMAAAEGVAAPTAEARTPEQATEAATAIATDVATVTEPEPARPPEEGASVAPEQLAAADLSLEQQAALAPVGGQGNQTSLVEEQVATTPVEPAQAKRAGAAEPAPVQPSDELPTDAQTISTPSAKPETADGDAPIVADVTTPETQSPAPVDPAGAAPDAAPVTSSVAAPVATVEQIEDSPPEVNLAEATPEVAATPEGMTAPVAGAAGIPRVEQTKATAQPASAPQSEPETAADEAGPQADVKPAPKPEVAVAVLRAGEDGVTLVQPSTPAVPELVGKVALDTIGYTETGEVQLAGRARPQALVRVYLDNSPVAELRTQADGRWSGSLTLVAPGIYTLRLDEIDPVEGKVLSRLETPFKRESPEVLQPVLAAETDSDLKRPRVKAVTVQKGDTLWAISQDRYGSGYLYLRVFEANKSDIRDPDLIYPGQIFTLPE
ncbi:LysM peptidoglycan-binding domain-containing protein [Phaeobacter sp. HF9A]|uniref:LysM peptidoglycan-binding domain-containing protein n=1 Tax=Phaeobacter sp. HF9A TaxID=2721561 RepID=UPI00143051BB|nr:LysM peptidoglycan-binding domain-containing protein [Phaeobacter sp. HF9A]NIZ14345.1 LysM peptidoglycan-binding domain-containing protein [Phaeobacter sp. HF9A]